MLAVLPTLLPRTLQQWQYCFLDRVWAGDFELPTCKLPSMRDQNIIVTGVAGFIGSHTAEALIQRGARVIGIDNFCDFYDRAWKEQNLKCINAGKPIEFEEMDITDGSRVQRLFEKWRPSAVVHLAAMAG